MVKGMVSILSKILSFMQKNYDDDKLYREQELNFAIRAKSGWPKGKTNEAIPMTLEDGISTFESTPGEYINIKQGMTAPKKMTDIMRGTKLPQKIQKQAEQKYGANNITTMGHSLGGRIAEKVGKKSAQIITYNKAATPKMPEPQP